LVLRWAKDQPRFHRMLIVVEGCVGIGKSTVAKGLTSIRRSEPLLERFDENPFLKLFYEDPVENAVETEFAFLLLHYHELKALNRKAKMIESITDFSFEKDRLYAKLNLTETSFFNVFCNLHSALAGRLPKPDLMICLTATDELVLSRIRNRNRPAEQQIDPSYYVRLNAAYSEFFAQQQGLKIFVDMNEVDFLKEPAAFRDLSEKIDASIMAKVSP
jgi:deoxyguanosine kinase